jgi:hypothetical protein
MIKVRCEKCGQKHGVDDCHAGKRIRCSQCKTPLMVPASPPPVLDDIAASLMSDLVTQAQQRKQAEPPPSRMDLNTYASTFEPADGRSSGSPEMHPGFRHCPACGATVSTAAKRCKFCKEWLSAAARKEEARRRAKEQRSKDVATLGLGFKIIVLVALAVAGMFAFGEYKKVAERESKTSPRTAGQSLTRTPSIPQGSSPLVDSIPQRTITIRGKAGVRRGAGDVVPVAGRRLYVMRETLAPERQATLLPLYEQRAVDVLGSLTDWRNRLQAKSNLRVFIDIATEQCSSAERNLTRIKEAQRSGREIDMHLLYDWNRTIQMGIGAMRSASSIMSDDRTNPVFELIVNDHEWLDVVASQTLYETATNADGTFTIAGLPSGEYKVYLQEMTTSYIVEWITEVTATGGATIDLQLTNDNALAVNRSR